MTCRSNWMPPGTTTRTGEHRVIPARGFMPLHLGDLILDWEELPVRDAARGPGGDNHVTVREEHGVVRVLVLLGGEEDRHVDDRDDLVGTVEHTNLQRPEHARREVGRRQAGYGCEREFAIAGF